MFLMHNLHCYSSDLEMVCQELDLGQCVQELLIELGADGTGKVSYKDFLNRRKALRLYHYTYITATIKTNL